MKKVYRIFIALIAALMVLSSCTQGDVIDTETDTEIIESIAETTAEIVGGTEKEEPTSPPCQGAFAPNCQCVKNAKFEEGKNGTECICETNYSWDEKVKECVNGAKMIMISFLIIILIMILF